MPDRIGILFVTNTLTTGGAEHVLIDLARRLARHERYRPVIACLKDRGPLADTLADDRIPIYDGLLTDKYDVKAIARLYHCIRAERVRIVVPVGSGGDRMFWSTPAAKVAGTKVVLWSHIYTQPNHPSFETLNRVLYPFVDQFVALGQRHRQSMAWLDKVPLGRITVINNGIDVDTFDHPEWRDRARAILGLADEHITAIGMIANLRDDKRHDLFIDAAKQVVQHRRDVHFLIIGDGPCRAAILRWAQQGDLLGQYLSLLGRRDDIAQILPGLDVLALCSEYHECLSLAALQAMAAHVPVVSSVIGSMDEAITDDETGFFFQPLTADAFARRLLAVIENPACRRDVAQNAYGRVKARFTAETMTHHFTTLFDKLLTPNPARHI